MLNIGVLCDINWDNYILIQNKFKKIDNEKFRLHSIYGKSLEIINNCAIKNNLVLVRSFSDSLLKTVYNMLKNCELWLIFTNHIEYNTPTRLIIESCIKYSIKYIVIAEFSRYTDYYSFECDKTLSFKKIINQIYKEKLKQKQNITDNSIDNSIDTLCSSLQTLDLFNKPEIEIYNELFSNKYNINLSLTPEIKQKIRQLYDCDKQHKNNKSIQILYDKEELKNEKRMKKAIKTVNQLDFTKNRMNYYKNLK